MEKFASDILEDYKKANKRLFILCIIFFIALMISIGYNWWLQKDISTIETTERTQEITNTENISNTNIVNGDIKDKDSSKNKDN